MSAHTDFIHKYSAFIENTMLDEDGFLAGAARPHRAEARPASRTWPHLLDRCFRPIGRARRRVLGASGRV